MNVDREARALYDACPTVKPAWDQLGEVTKGVWRQNAKLKLAGIADYYRLHYSWPHLDLANVSSLADVRMLASRASGVLRHLPPGVTMDLNHKQVADTLDEIAGLYLKLSGHFRAASGGGSGASVDGKAGGKPAAKSAGKPSKPAAKEEEADTPIELTEDDVREKLKELAGAKGKEKMVEALESVGAAKLADVDEPQYNELVAKVDELLAEEEETEQKPPAKKAAAKKTAKKAGPTLDDVTEAAKALIDADKPAYLKITKKLGKPSEMDESVYAEAIAAYQEAMPTDGDDDLL